ncbi:MAG: GntR family transcriptional regulator [Micromonosporaceae bacterium]
MPNRYEQIAADLRRAIAGGELAPDDQLPTEDQLADRYTASLGTVQAAKRLLEAEGLIEGRPGKGSFVRPPRRQVRRTGERHQWEKDRVHLVEDERAKTGAVEYDTGLDFADIDFPAVYNPEPASDHLAGVFDVPAGTQLLHRRYVSSERAAGAPVSLIDSWLVWDTIKGNPKLLDDRNEPWPGGTQHQLSTVGIELARVVEEFTARPPTPDEADQLRIGPGVSVIALRKTSLDTTGRVVEYSEVIMPGDRTVMVYTTKLERWPE